jgi:hypothetical protein
MPLTTSTIVNKSNAPLIVFDTPKAIIKTPMKNIAEPK